MMDTTIKPDDELDWVKVREDLENNYLTETIFQKAKRKTRENPLVPLGKLTYVLICVTKSENKAGERRQRINEIRLTCTKESCV